MNPVDAFAEKAKIHLKLVGPIKPGRAHSTLNVLSDIADAPGVRLPDLFAFDNGLGDTKQLRKELLAAAKKKWSRPTKLT